MRCIEVEKSSLSLCSAVYSRYEVVTTVERAAYIARIVGFELYRVLTEIEEVFTISLFSDFFISIIDIFVNLL